MSYCKMHKKIRNNNSIGLQLSLDSHLQRRYMQYFKRVLLVPSFIVQHYPVVKYTKVWEQVSDICSIHYDKL
jgi:hypothetical protein